MRALSSLQLPIAGNWHTEPKVNCVVNPSLRHTIQSHCQYDVLADRYHFIFRCSSQDTVECSLGRGTTQVSRVSVVPSLRPSSSISRRHVEPSLDSLVDSCR